MRNTITALMFLFFCGCSTSHPPADVPEGSYAVSLLGRPLKVPVPSKAAQERMLRNLEAARAAWEAEPDNENRIIWYGRRLAYLGRYAEAIQVYTDGLRIHPRSYRLLRHRGHRYITTRKLDLAIADLSRAAAFMKGAPLETEPDGIPNKRNTPIGSTQGNVWYHLGLAHYLKGEFASALRAYDRRHAETDRNDDNRASTAYWRFLILSRLDRKSDALNAVRDLKPDIDIIENTTYLNLGLLYAGGRTLEEAFPADVSNLDAGITDATRAYGLSMLHYVNGNEDKAQELWEEIIRTSRSSTAFGYIAAEAELSRR